MYRLEIWAHASTFGIDILPILVEGRGAALSAAQVVQVTGVNFQPRFDDEALERGAVLTLSAALFAQLRAQPHLRCISLRDSAVAVSDGPTIADCAACAPPRTLPPSHGTAHEPGNHIDHP